MRSNALTLSVASAVISLGLVLSSRAQFADGTADAGLTWNQSTWGAAFGDLDNDGDLDLYAGHHYFPPVIFWNDGTGMFDQDTYPQPWSGPIDRHGALLLSLDSDEDLEMFIAHGADGGAGAETNELYRNDGGGLLLSLLNAAGAADPLGRKRSVSAADFNLDHRVDLFTAEAPDAVDRNSLFQNNGALSFTEVAPLYGLDEALGTVGGIWGDVDDDGDPDLLVGGEEFPRPTTLWRNDGSAFHDASDLFVPPLPVVSGADWGDIDNDGDLDLAVVQGNVGLFDTFSQGDTLRYYFNTRYGDTGLDGLTIPSNADTAYAMFRLRAVADTSKIFLGPNGAHPSPGQAIALSDAYVGEPAFTPGVSQGTFVWRESSGGQWEIRCSTHDLGFDNFDGFLTEAVPISGVAPVDLEDPSFTPGGPRVWRNDGGVFHEITAALRLPVMLNPRDVSLVDYDNDGLLDLHVVDMGTSAKPNAPDGLWHNNGPGHVWTDVTTAEGVEGGTTGMGDGAIWGDIDGDLDLDLFLQEGAGPLTFSAYGPARLLLNKGERGHALILNLVGRESGAPALGAVVTVVAGPLRLERRIQANSWRGFQDPRDIHVGIGAATVADSVIVQWPVGTVREYLQVPAGRWRLDEDVPITSAQPSRAIVAVGWRLVGVAPQPARGAQRILLEVPSATSLEVAVRDLAGRAVRTLHRGPLPPGRASLAWDGLDDRGHRVAAGVYFIRASDGTRARTVKSIRLR